MTSVLHFTATLGLILLPGCVRPVAGQCRDADFPEPEKLAATPTRPSAHRSKRATSYLSQKSTQLRRFVDQIRAEVNVQGPADQFPIQRTT